jgi:hypothetical protein
MTRALGILGTIAFLFILSISACNMESGGGQETPLDASTDVETWMEDAQLTLDSFTTPSEAPATQTPSPVPTSTTTPTPTLTLTPTALPPMISASENMHCRSGPGTSYPSLDVLFADQAAQILARSTLEDFWYIEIPEKSGKTCWVSGFYATVEGDVSVLPVYTPIPSPTPEVGFDLYLRSFETGYTATYVVFSVRNTGGQTLKSANVSIFDLDTDKYLYKPTFQRFPFAPAVRPVDPPGHGNILAPGELQYIHVPIDPVPHGHNAHGVIKLCTEDYQGGECVTRELYFPIE